MSTATHARKTSRPKKVWTVDRLVASGKCWRCHRTLTDPVSVQLGLGPVCRTKVARDCRDGDQSSDNNIVDLPFDPGTMDITCARDLFHKAHFNIAQRIRKHSDGMEWGYLGSGPSDFALNILALFIGRDAAEQDGLYHDFKAAFVARLPEEGGTIKGEDIRAWIRAQGVRLLNAAEAVA